MEYEIGHINISIHNGEDNKGSVPVVNWHKDSYPFVCVVMLSDATEMKGGETALRTGTGEIMKVRGPQMVSSFLPYDIWQSIEVDKEFLRIIQGSAIILQGRYITHIALPSTNCRERVTLVTSFRAKEPTVPDDSVLTTVRAVSDLNELYSQWTEYRVEIVEERCRRLVKKVRNRKRVGRDFDIAGIKSELEELKTILERTSREIVDEAEKKKGLDQEEKGIYPKRARHNWFW